MATVQLPKVQLTQLFRAALAAEGIPPDALAVGFASWKASGAPGFLKDPYFGKDSAYARPLRDNRTVLWHVHLRPESDNAASLEWDQRTRENQVKTSDAVLIYTHSLQFGYLLLHAVFDAGAHEFANMSTPTAERMMNQFADVAAEFIFWGKVAV